MTPAQLDHLKRIDEHLARLLDIAAKRTPGRWYAKHYEGGLQSVVKAGMDIPRIVASSEWNAQDDAAYIASCSGNAEAGWRATRAAIAAFQEECPHGCMPHCPHHKANEKHIESILAAVPLELLP